MTRTLATIWFLFVLLLASPFFSITPAEAQAGSPPSYEQLIDSVSLASVREHMSVLSNVGSRVTGYPGFWEAATYIRDTFQAYGLTDISAHEFDVVVPIDLGANITLNDGADITVQAYTIWPNSVQLSVARSLTGPLLYGGTGYLYELDGKSVEGSIVVLEGHNTRYRWLNAAMLGAKAVVFVGRFDRWDADMMYVGTPLNFTRVYVPDPDGSTLRELAKAGSSTVTLKAEMKWEKIRAANIVGWVRGTDAAAASQTVIIGAHYDSWSVVPGLSPGADESAGIASLLELARFFAAHPARRSVLFVAFAGHNQGLSGSRQFVEDTYFGSNPLQVDLSRSFTSVLHLSTDTDQMFLPGFGYFYKMNEVGTRRGYWGAQGVRWEVIERFIQPEIERAWTAKYGRTWMVDTRNSGGFGRLEDYWWLCIGSRYNLDSEPFSVSGGTGFGLVTAKAYMALWGTPFDTLEGLQVGNLKPQVEYSLASLYKTVDYPQDYPSIMWRPNRFAEGILGGFATLHGQVVEWDPETGRPDKPVPNAIVHMYLKSGGYFSVSGQSSRDPNTENLRHEYFLMTDDLGRFSAPGLQTSMEPPIQLGSYEADPYVLDGDGRVVYSPDIAQSLLPEKYPNIFTVYQGEIGTVDNPRPFVVFKSASVVFYDMVDPLIQQEYMWKYYETVYGALKFQVLDQRTHFQTQSYGTAPFGNLVIAFVPPETPLEFTISVPAIESFPYGVVRNLTLPGATAQEGQLMLGDQVHVLYSPVAVAGDLYSLSRERLETVRQFYASSPLADAYMRYAQLDLETAQRSLANESYSVAISKALGAWSVSWKAYTETMQLVDDVVNSIIFLAVLVIPFAFLFERLMIHNSNSKMVLAAVLTISGLSLAFFYFFHAGFHIASNSVMVIIALVAVALSMPVFAFLGSQVMQIVRTFGREAAVHRVEVSRTGLATVITSTAVEYMRRRRFRTGLTFISILLIAMGLVSFTSISGLGVTRATVVPRTQETPYQGILVRSLANPPVELTENLVEFLRYRFPDSVLAPRVWWYAPYMELGMPIYTTRDTSTRFYAMLGLSANEEKVTASEVLLEGRWISDDFEPAILVNSRQADELGVQVGDYVLFNSMKLNVIGIYDIRAFDAIFDLDGNLISPVDVRRSRQGEPPVYMPFDELVIVPAGLLLRLGGRIMAVSIILPEIGQTVPNSEDLAQRLMIGVHASYQGGVSIYTYGGAFQIMGAEMIAIPFVIAALMMVNLMLGAVYERRREIGIFGALGLSPTHVSLLFFGEAVVYGVLGATMGYIVGVSVGVTAYAGGFFPATFTPNFSSISVVITLGLVVLAVIVSTVYPTMQASKMMTPSLERKWKIPTKPIGGEWVIPMPLSVPEDSVNGVLAFMHGFVRLHTRREAGGFMASDWACKETTIEGRTARLLSFEAHVAPFEKSVRQRVEIISTRTETGWVFQCVLHHLAGELGDWQRLNRVFIDSVKKQLLLWTLQPGSVRDEYIGRGNKLLVAGQEV